MRTTEMDHRIVETVRRLGVGLDDKIQAELLQLPAAEPNRVRDRLAELLPGEVIVTGTLDRRLLLAEQPSGRWLVVDLSGAPHADRHWLEWARSGVLLDSGQHDLLIRLLDSVDSVGKRPLVLAGGSLTARNERLLLEQFPWLMIARSAGEPTMADTIAYWHGDIDRDQIRGIGYSGAARGEGTLSVGRFRKTATVANRAQTDFFPELDLLASTFEHRGVAQLESSRGCTNYCSFCPRGHKGTWSGVPPDALPTIVSAMGKVFDRFPEVSRTLYLVDEEFIGRGDDAATRAVEVAGVLHDAQFKWETSCRVDQVAMPGQGWAWHVERAAMWRILCARGLRRCLFGVESGVTSVLEPGHQRCRVWAAR